MTSGIKFEWHRAVSRAALKDGIKLTALALWDYADADGQNARPGSKELADVRGVSERSISTHLAELATAGWCRKTQDGRTVGRRNSASTYKLTFPEGADHMKPGLPMVGADHMKPELPMVPAKGPDHRKPGLLPNRSETPTAVVRTEKPEPLRDDWAPNAQHRHQANKRNLDADVMALKFRSWAIENGKRFRDWDLRFASWIADEKPKPQGVPTSGSAGGRLWQE